MLTPLAPSCASAIRATSGSMTTPAQVSSSADLWQSNWNRVQTMLILFWLGELQLPEQTFCVGGGLSGMQGWKKCEIKRCFYVFLQVGDTN